MSKLDPRVMFVWWVVISTLAFLFTSSPIKQAFLAGIVILTWILSGKAKGLLSYLRIIAPMAIFISVFRLDKPQELAVYALRFFAMVGSSAFVISMGTSMMTSALRNLKSRHLPFLDTPIELFAYLLSQGLVIIPVVASEITKLQEAQRARGVDLRGNPIKRAKNSIGLVLPLFGRILDRNRMMGIASDVLGYDPFAKKTVFVQLKFSRSDYIMTGVILVLFVFALIIKV